MASKVQICNKGLIHIGNSNTLASLTEASEEARLCNQVYDENREELLRQWPWGFATKEVSLALTGTDAATNWTYEYQYPNDCFLFVNIVNTASRVSTPPPHHKGVNASNEVVLWSDEANAIGRYVTNVTDPNKFDAGFKQVLSLLIAVDICLPLTHDRGLQRDLIQRAANAYVKAAQADAQETSIEEMPDPDWILARG